MEKLKKLLVVWAMLWLIWWCATGAVTDFVKLRGHVVLGLISGVSTVAMGLAFHWLRRRWRAARQSSRS